MPGLPSRIEVPLRVTAGVLIMLAVMVTAACNNAPLKVSTIQLGKTLNSDNSVGTHATSFKPRDAVYASVLTPASGSGTIETKWYYGSSKVSEMKKDVSYRGEAATEFRFQNSAGLPQGPYKVEVFLDGQLVGERTFRVE
jgi:hypothetical protein